MQLHELPRGRQLSMHGNIVNVPTNVTSTVKQCHFNCGHHYQFQTVRPANIITAVRWLVENSAVYREEGIAVNNDWETEFSDQLKSIAEDNTSFVFETVSSEKGKTDTPNKILEVGDRDDDTNKNMNSSPHHEHENTLQADENGPILRQGKLC